MLEVMVTGLQERLRLAIAKSGLKKSKIAAAAGIHPQVLTNILGGRHPGKHLESLSKALDVSLAWLMHGEQEPAWLRRQKRDRWSELAWKVSAASGTDPQECANLLADKLHARAIAAGLFDFPIISDLLKFQVEHVRVIREDYGRQEGRLDAYRDLPRDEYETIVSALASEHERAADAWKAAPVKEQDRCLKHLLTVRRALANIVYRYVLANNLGDFPGGVDGEHGIERVRRIIGTQQGWSVLGVRWGLRVEDT